jgi:hypothetical protein
MTKAAFIIELDTDGDVDLRGTRITKLIESLSRPVGVRLYGAPIGPQCEALLIQSIKPRLASHVRCDLRHDPHTLFPLRIRIGPRPKKRGPSPRGAARKGRAYLTGKRFGISKVIMIISATGRRRFRLFGFGFRFQDVDRGRIQRVLEMDGIVLFNHFDTGTAVLGDLINICPLH